MATASRKTAKKAHDQQLLELAGRIRAYDPNFGPSDLQDVLNLVEKFPKVPASSAWNSHFSDPLQTIERLATFERADRDTLIAAALYPSMVPQGKNGIDYNRLEEIESRFGPQVKHIIQDAISLWSLDKLSPKNQNPKDNARDYKLMALLVARSKKAVLIRSDHAYYNVEEFDMSDNDRGRRDYVFTQAEIMADLAYLAGFTEMRRRILNASLRIKDPKLYAEIRQDLDSAPLFENPNRKPVSRKQAKGREAAKTAKLVLEETEAAVKSRIADALLQELPKLTADDFKLEFRQKDAYSVAEKTVRKGQGLGQLGDKFGARIIFKQSYIDQFATPGPTESLEWDDPARLGREQNLCELAHGRLARIFGRFNRAPEYRGLFQKLAGRDPSAHDPTKDDRFDNYYKTVKESGYRAVQDALFVIHDGAVIELEAQFVGELTHEQNTHGNPSHRMMKTDFFPNAMLLEEWEKCCEKIVGPDSDEQAPIAAVYDSGNDIQIVKGSCRVTDYLTEHFAAIQAERPEIESIDDIVGVCLDNRDPFIQRKPNEPISPAARLRSGDRIVKIVTKNDMTPA